MAVTLASTAALVVFFIGLHRAIPAGDIDALSRADQSSGALRLEFDDVPRGFHVDTTIDVYDSSYRYSSDYSAPIHESFTTRPPKAGQSDLQEVFIRADLTAPDSRRGVPPAPVTWELTSSGSGQLANLADVSDNGKYRGTDCSFGTDVGRVPDNAVELNAHGPDPRTVSYAYVHRHTRVSTFSPADAAATPRLYRNSTVKGNATAYAGVLCPEPSKQPPDPSTPQCKASQVHPVATVGPSAAARARAAALGIPAQGVEMGLCPLVITKLSLGADTPLFFGSIFAKPLMTNSSSGAFAVHLPHISVVSYDTTGRASYHPVNISLFPRHLIDSGLKASVAPEFPLVTRARYRWVSSVRPRPVVWCSVNSQCPDGRVLVWQQNATPLDIELAGRTSRLRMRTRTA